MIAVLGLGFLFSLVIKSEFLAFDVDLRVLSLAVDLTMKVESLVLSMKVESLD